MPDMPTLSQSQDEVLQGLRDWIGKALKKAEERLERLSKKKKKSEEEENHIPPIVLSWSDPDGQEKVVYEFDFEEMNEAGGVLPIAEKLYAIALRDAVALGEKQTYFVTLEKFPGRFPLVFLGEEDGDFDDPAGEGEDDPDVEEPEDPPGRGMSFGGGGGGGAGFGGSPGVGRVPIFDYVEWAKVRTQHEQAMMKDVRLERQEVFRMMRSTIQELSETVQSYNKEHARARVELEELISQRHVRDLDHKNVLLGEERKEKAFQMLEPFARAMAVKLMGPAAMMGENSQTMAQLFESVFSTLTPEQFQKLQTVLSPEQIQNIGQLFDTIKNLEDQRTAQTKKVAERVNGVGPHPASPNANGAANGANGHAHRTNPQSSAAGPFSEEADAAVGAAAKQ